MSKPSWQLSCALLGAFGGIHSTWKPGSMITGVAIATWWFLLLGQCCLTVQDSPGIPAGACLHLQQRRAVRAG